MNIFFFTLLTKDRMAELRYFLEMPSFIQSHAVAAGSTQVLPESNALATRDLQWSNSGSNALLKGLLGGLQDFQRHHCKCTSVFSYIWNPIC